MRGDPKKFWPHCLRMSNKQYYERKFSQGKRKEVNNYDTQEKLRSHEQEGRFSGVQGSAQSEVQQGCKIGGGVCSDATAKSEVVRS